MVDHKSIACWAVHPGGPRILSAETETLGLDPALIEPSRSMLRDCGKTLSPSLLFILERLWRSGDQAGAWRWRSGQGSATRWRSWREKENEQVRGSWPGAAVKHASSGSAQAGRSGGLSA